MPKFGNIIIIFGCAGKGSWSILEKDFTFQENCSVCGDGQQIETTHDVCKLYTYTHVLAIHNSVYFVNGKKNCNVERLSNEQERFMLPNWRHNSSSGATYVALETQATKGVWLDLER